MNLKKSLQFRQEDGDLWFPVTPQKPLVCDSNPSTVELQGSQTISNNFPEVLGSSSPIATSMQGNQAGNENWEELIGIYSELLQQTTKSKCDGIQNSCTLQQTSSNAFPIPYQSSYNLDSPPRKRILGASHTTNCSEIAPHTPDQGKQIKSYQLSVVHEFSVDGSLNHEKDTQEITSTDGKEVKIHSDQLLQCVIASPSPSKSRSLKDKNICEDGGYGGIDLITLTDGKDVQIHSDQLLQSVIASPSPSNSSSLKDKNICEDGSHGGIDLNKTPQLKTPKRKKHRPKVVVEGKSKRTPKLMPLKTQNSTSSGKRKYVRKNGLRDSTSQDDNETKPVGAPSVQSAVKSCRRVLNFGKEAEVQDLGTISSMGLNRISTIPAAKEEQQKRYSAETQQSESICNLLNATNQTSPDKFLPLSATAPPTAARDHTLNVIARSINLKNAMAYQSQNQLGYSKVHQQIHGEATSQMPLHPNTAWPKLEAKQLMLQSRIESINCMAEPNEKRRHRRDYCNISDLTHCPTVQLMHLKFNGKLMNDSRKPGIDNSESHGKRQFEDTLHEAACTMSVNQCLRQIESRGSNMIHVSSAPYNNAQYNNERKNSPWQQTSSASGIGTYQYKDPRVIGKFFQEQRYLSEVKLQGDCMAGQFFQQHTESHTPSLLTGITNQNMLSPPQKVPITTQTIKTTTPEDHKAMKRQMVGLESPLLELSKERVLPKHYKKETGYLPFSRKARGKNEKQVHAINIDEITCQLKQMQISKSTKALVRKRQTALVPYEGDKAIVPYGEFDLIRRRKLRPRVDLDPETNQLWDLLMGKPGSESAETIGKDKEKWWENEREVFRGRVDSFIARMHLVQGDRRFSRWKGSVVDSVIGVFLTQNVTDHLSSSVFMSLAAEFPQPRTVNLASEWEEPEVQIIDPDGTITFQDRRIRRPLHKHKSMASSGSSEQKSGYFITEAGIHLVKENNRAAEEEVFSSQNSSESLILQANGEIQSSSDSEVEDQVILCSANQIQSLKYTPLTDRAASVQQHQIPETRSPLMDNRPMLECKKQPSLVCIRQDSAPNIGGNVYGYPINSNIQHSEGSFAQSQTGLMNHCSGGGPSGSESNKIPKKRKRKLDEKTKPFDWDTLRKQVLLKGGKQKRCKDRMDSLNYDALRNADVNKISDIIKERGMNNMLAGRIKDFLDRLVRDHGSIDLEWLRDVSPDKAKEFLLSIRGLGLKSVECVRLLTLHHMAFPVDTNVGRIAVRLGWVPLQPLPESLQLHLLELYPVLESIQKYLWPRLCKLDQRTLYELHYQMITFGKVFCTKSKPNCNACPMRAECRHFASAFASTRLALPGPEERSIVSSTIPMAPNETPNLVLKPMPLPPPENSIVRELQYISSQQEPIIEEPTTPEAFTEFSESDIEDILSQDTDEIPTIDLSLEELKMNVKEFMKDRNVGIPEAALSKALVALNSADASIPAPKLKNVNRLRTEHQVYEIPDSHPLLEGMDRREPDDPSPYLLAIWTPGETANSTQPPESKCGFQGTGKLCNDKTCFSCNNVREANSQIVRGTILIPCRTATRGSFPLNGTYFQVNEVFADHESSFSPINVPRDWLWPLARRTVYFGTSVSAIFRGLSTTGIQYCFWRGFVCVRGFDRKARSPRPLTARLHYPASKKPKNKNENKEKQR